MPGDKTDLFNTISQYGNVACCYEMLATKPLNIAE